MSKVKIGTKLVVFDMDSALLQHRFIDVCAKEFNFYQALTLLRQIDQDAVSLANRTASFLTGKNIQQLHEISNMIPLVKDVDMVVEELKARGCIVGIISDCYQAVVETIGKRIKVDFSLGYELCLQGNYITGELRIPSCFEYADESTCRHRTCKSNALTFLCAKYSIPLHHSIAVGDAENDACLANHAGMHFPLSTSNGLFTEVAKRQLAEQSLRDLLMYAS
jgi:HAD superfamily phosphoserine phosphatase-like hydrolase